MRVLAVDQGTTNTKALLFARDGTVVAQASARCSTAYPQSGWAEQSASEIWETTRAVIAEIVAKAGADDIAAIGISNQRETIVAWNAETGEPVGPAILWQCRRTADVCAALGAAGHGDKVQDLTGLQINPLFPASKLAWILKNNPNAAMLAEKGQLRAGTVDAWLVWNLTGGKRHATDQSNASRTLMFDTRSLSWSRWLGEIFEVPLPCLPEVLSSDGHFGDTAMGMSALPPGVPILSVMGDSHAALYGHGVRAPGPVKATYGTGSSLMTLTPSRLASAHNLSSTIAWASGGNTHYAIEGNITVSAQAAAFAANLLGLGDAAALSELAETVPDAAGVHFVPALAGLGAPHWDDAARGTISGLSLGSTPAHLARATFEAIAHQVADVFEAMQSDVGHPLDGVVADGGASANGFLMQVQANLLGRPVTRGGLAEIGAFGVARMAFEALGAPMDMAVPNTTHFAPALSDEARSAARRHWHDAVAQARYRPA